MKTIKSWLFKTYLKEKNCGHGVVCLLVGYISVKKNIKNCNSVGAGAHKVGKVVSFLPKFDPILPIFGARKIGCKLSILKMVDLSRFREILKNVYLIALSCFLTCFYFVWKGTLGP